MSWNNVIDTCLKNTKKSKLEHNMTTDEIEKSSKSYISFLLNIIARNCLFGSPTNRLWAFSIGPVAWRHHDRLKSAKHLKLFFSEAIGRICFKLGQCQNYSEFCKNKYCACFFLMNFSVLSHKIFKNLWNHWLDLLQISYGASLGKCVPRFFTVFQH